MKKFLFYTTLLAVCPLLLIAQAPDTLWTKTYGGTGNDVGNTIKQTADGGYIIAGYTESFGAGQQDVLLIKTDSIGDTLWTKTYGGVYNDWAEDVEQTTDGGYIIAANTNSFGYGRIWQIKTDSQGDTTWTKNHGGYCCYAIQPTSDGGYIIAGNAGGIGPHPLLIKTEANGDTTWTWYTIWSGEDGCFFSVKETFDSGFIAAGCIGSSPVLGDWLCKFNTDGDTVWSNWYFGEGSLSSVRQNADTGYVACGTGWQDDLLVLRTDSLGDTLWTRNYGNSQLPWSGNSMQLTNDNGYIITGVYRQDVASDILLFKIDENGDSLWCAVYGEDGYADCGNEVLQTYDGGYIVTGYTESYGAGGSDVWVIKTVPDVGVQENENIAIKYDNYTTTVFSGPLLPPEGKKCRVFDIMGRVVVPDKIRPGIYFMEIDGKILKKVIKIK